MFRDSRTGLRAVLVAGPDVREAIRVVKSARVAEPDRDAAGVVALVEASTGVPALLVDEMLSRVIAEQLRVATSTASPPSKTRVDRDSG